MGVVLSGAEVVFLYLGIEVLAGEFEGIRDILRALRGQHLTERLVRAGVLDSALVVDYQADRAQAVSENAVPGFEWLVRPLAASVSIDVSLGIRLLRRPCQRPNRSLSGLRQRFEDRA